MFIIGSSDFDSLMSISFTNSAEIRFFSFDDEITLEYDDSVIYVFTPYNPALIPRLEAAGEFIRDTATVNIIDDDREHASKMVVLLSVSALDTVCSDGTNMRKDAHKRKISAG